MKKIFMLFMLFFAINSIAQINYESIVKYSNGTLVDKKMITLKFSIHANSPNGTVVYREIQHPLTSNIGKVTSVVGRGLPEVGSFSQINWSQGNYYLIVEFFTGNNSCEWIYVPFYQTNQTNQLIYTCSGEQTLTPCPLYTNLVWSDEFNENGAVNSSKWHHQTQLPNGNSWYNGEVQHYTNNIANSFAQNGVLNIVAKKESYTSQGVTKQYTSARLNSKFAFTYGRIEVRAKLPSGLGTWPAIWTLGKNIIEPGGFWSATHGTVAWPSCGEIDIMEHWGHNQNFVQSALHTPSSNGSTNNLGGTTVSTASSEFHIYSLEWTPEKMSFSVDGQIYYVYNPSVKNAYTWPFNSDQYILLNLAIQPPVDSSINQRTLEVDYVRVYQ
jgi:beta-glucanase (GH16 family)